jgi:DNA-binding transcriptional ArsR family regulator
MTSIRPDLRRPDLLRLRLGTADLGRIRFAFSPVWETVTSLRALSTGNGLHTPWLRDLRGCLGGIDLPMLTALVPPTGYIPDFLTPSPPRRSSSFESGLAAIAATPPATVAADLADLAADQRGRAAPDLRQDPAAALAQIVTELDRYWQAAVRPHWPRIRALLDTDLAYRMDELSAGGIAQLFRTLHPRVSFDSDTITVAKPTCELPDIRGRGLLLVPCLFAWPDVLVLVADPHVPTVTYSPRGAGRVWHTAPDTARSPLSDLLGTSRAAVVAQLDLPMSTTQLACQLDLTPPTLSVHLKTLRAAGIVTSRRTGRTVLYHRTPLGDQLLTTATT